MEPKDVTYAIVENREQVLQDHLALFQTPSLVKAQLLKTRSGLSDKLAEKKGKHISWCVKQAAEYLHASRNVSLMTKPVLIYYSLMAYAQACILADHATSGLEQLAKTHGITTPTSDAEARDLRSLDFLIEAHGTASELLEIIANDELAVRYLNRDTQIVNTTTYVTPRGEIGDIKNRRFSVLSDVLAYLPDFQTLLEVVYPGEGKLARGGLSTSTYQRDGEPWQREVGWMVIAPWVSEMRDQLVARGFSVDDDTGTLLTFHREQKMENGAVADNRVPDVILTPTGDLLYFILPEPYLPEMVRHLCAAFAFCQVARYRPYIWGKMLANQGFLIDSALREIVSRFTAQALNRLRGEIIVVTSRRDALNAEG